MQRQARWDDRSRPSHLNSTRREIRKLFGLAGGQDQFVRWNFFQQQRGCRPAKSAVAPVTMIAIFELIVPRELVM